jgi:hypothetical protein
VSGFTLGQRVRFTNPMKRQSVPLRHIERVRKSGTTGQEYTDKLPINKAWVPNQFAKEQEGIIVGKRTLANGYCSWEEWGTVHEPAEHFTAYMIVTDLRSAPVHVLPEHIKPLMEDCDGSSTCDSLAHIEGCFATNPDFKKENAS